jgi:hypothetical protein
MKSLQRRFNEIASEHQNWSSYLIFAEAIKKQKFSKRVIKEWFNKLVDKDDYAPKEKREILQFLYNLSFSSNSEYPFFKK